VRIEASARKLYASARERKKRSRSSTDLSKWLSANTKESSLVYQRSWGKKKNVLT